MAPAPEAGQRMSQPWTLQWSQNRGQVWGLSLSYYYFTNSHLSIISQPTSRTKQQTCVHLLLPGVHNSDSALVAVAADWAGADWVPALRTGASVWREQSRRSEPEPEPVTLEDTVFNTF